MLENAELTGLFPTPILKIKRPCPLTMEELEAVKSYDIEYSSTNGISKSYSVLEDPKLKNIKTFCQEAVNLFTERVYGATANELDIGISWINAVEPNKVHRSHVHKNAIISGVYYLQNTFDCSLYVINPLVIHNMYDFSEYKENNHFNSETWDLPVEEDTLVLFPAWLSHGVRTNKNKENRYSIAFNTWFKKDREYGFPQEKTFIRT